MTCEARIEKEMFGKTCDVKYIKSFTEMDFKSKYGELHDKGYQVIWKTVEGVIMRYKWNDTDVVILNCKAPIKRDWILEQLVIIAASVNTKGTNITY